MRRPNKTKVRHASKYETYCGFKPRPLDTFADVDRALTKHLRENPDFAGAGYGLAYKDKLRKGNGVSVLP